MSEKTLEREMREMWFKDHRAVHTGSEGNMELLTWCKPGNSNYRIDYIMHNRYLIVTGDLGCAMYWWSGENDLRWVSQCSLGYFASKCEASENGRGYKEFNAEHLRSQIEHELTSREENNDQDTTRIKFMDIRGFDYIYDMYEWIGWIQANGEEVFGCDYWEIGLDGMRLNPRCESHLIGLKMAFEQIDKEAANVGRV